MNYYTVYDVLKMSYVIHFVPKFLPIVMCVLRKNVFDNQNITI